MRTTEPSEAATAAIRGGWASDPRVRLACHQAVDRFYAKKAAEKAAAEAKEKDA